MNSDRRLEIFGILLVSISLFILISLLGYNSNEEPLISPNIKIENPMNFWGLFITYTYKIRIWLHLIFFTFFRHYLGLVYFFKKNLEKLSRITKFLLILMILVSLTTGTLLNLLNESDKSYSASGLIGGNLAELFISFFSSYGTIIFLTASYLVLVRAYFDLNYYAPFSFFL